MKMKTTKIVSKRFKLSKNGVVMRGKQNLRHLRRHKSKRQLRRLSSMGSVTNLMTKKIGIFLPYGSI